MVLRDMITKEELRDYELVHDHAGNGFAMVEDIDKDYCRVCRIWIGDNGKIKDAFLAWKPKLKVFMLRPDKDSRPEPVLLSKPRAGVKDFDKELAIVREGFRKGLLKVKDTHIIYPRK